MRVAFVGIGRLGLHLAGSLLRAGHDVSCLTVTDEAPARVDEARTRLLAATPEGRLRWQAFPLRGGVHPLRRKLRNVLRPFSELTYAPGFAAALAAELARGYDVLHLEQLWSGWAGLGRPRTLLNIHHLEVIEDGGEILGIGQPGWRFGVVLGELERVGQDERVEP